MSENIQEPDEFEKLLCEHMKSIERFVYFRMPCKADADDILQESYLTAYQKFNTLNDKSLFKSWIISIAKNKCNDYFRQRAKNLDIPLDLISETKLGYGRYGITETNVVRETLDTLGDKDKQILYLFYFLNLPQAQIAERLGIPLGTVKSRLHVAKANFKQKYPYPPKSKGEIIMKELPEFMPEYTIVKSDKKPFLIKWEELMGWFIIPKLNEKISWAMYDFPEKKRTQCFDIEVVGKAEVHGIEGVEIISKEYNTNNSEHQNADVKRTFVAQLTETHCRLLAESHMVGEVKKIYTFLDGDDFLKNWGFGEDNCGNLVNIKMKGDIIRNGNEIKCIDKPFLMDIVGRYNLTINGKTYDTVCVIDIDTYNPYVVSEQYLDKDGRTILWRRFNHNDWAINRYKQKWTEKLPTNERLNINGETYVHWYDCITDYIM